MLLSHQRLSDLIGAIYDCAIDPEPWPGTIEKICQELKCNSGLIHLVDMQHSKIVYAKTWNFDTNNAKDHYDAFIQYFRMIRAFLLTHPIDEAYAGSRLDLSPLGDGRPPVYLAYRPEKHPAENQVPDQHVDWIQSLIDFGRKTGAYEALNTIVFRNPSRIGCFVGFRDASGGLATDDDLALLTMLAPHIRRSVTISDLLELKKIEAQALATTLDKLALGVIVVAGDCRILHANESAKHMFAAASPVRSLQGRLQASGPANEELSRAVALAKAEVDIGKVGIAIALQTELEEPALAHVLPLARGDVRSRLLPQAAAAIFISQPGKGSFADLSGFADIFKLTPAETRVLRQLVHGGTTMLEVATELSISEATAKTHLSHILAKTGVSRQTDLIALVRDLMPPVGAGRA